MPFDRRDFIAEEASHRGVSAILSDFHIVPKQNSPRENSFINKTIPSTRSNRPNSALQEVFYENGRLKKEEDPKSEMASAGDAEGIIDYGLSVEVMEDSRREVIQEIMEIRKYNKETEGNINQETEKEKQLQKDLGYAQREIDSLCKGIDVEHEKAKTHRSFINKLQADYELQIALPLRQSTSPWKSSSTTSTNPITPDDKASTQSKNFGYPSGPTGSMLTKRHVKFFKELRGKLGAYERDIEKGCTEIEEASEMLRIVQKIIKDHDLDGALGKARADARKFRDDYDESDRYRQKLYEAIGAAKDHLAQLKQEATSKVRNQIKVTNCLQEMQNYDFSFFFLALSAIQRKNLHAIQQAHRELESAETEKLATLRSKMVDVQAKKNNMESTRDCINTQSKELASLKEEYRHFIEKRVALQTKSLGLATRKSGLDQQKEALKEKLEAAKELQLKAERRHKDATMTLDTVTKLQSTSANHEESVMAEDEKEILRLMERKEKLVGLTIELEAKLEHMRNKHLARKEKMEEENEKLIVSISEVKASIQEKKDAMLEMNKRHAAYKVSMENEINEAESRRDRMKSVWSKTTETRAVAFRHAVLNEGATLIEKSKYPS
jgi:hypothetical protein